MATMKATCQNCKYHNPTGSINKVPTVCWSCGPSLPYWEPKETMNDKINSPSHYTSGGIEAIDYIKAKLGTDGCIAYCLGNVIKYVSRAGKKDIQKELEDLKKAQWYLNKTVSLITTDEDYYVS